ncbi:MAG: hypothetical protein DI630_16475 [Gordonia sp. (in: high G+C Gram-positive bacteria)]|nr:MAG: hypothetical protein DI630_16475 [Gordonia sp. (in: high G+C Gram-positive bacteria)]
MPDQPLHFPEPSLELREFAVTKAREVREWVGVNGGSNGDFVGGRADDVDGGLALILEGIQSSLADAVGSFSQDLARYGDLSESDAHEVFAAAHAWTAVISRTVAEVYAPASPFPGSWAGWGRRVTAKLQRLAATLGPILRAAAKASGATGASVSISFPWGMSASINW